MPNLKVVVNEGEAQEFVPARAEHLRSLEAMLFASAEPPEEKAVRRSRILLRRRQFVNPDVTKSDRIAVVLLICRGALQRVPTLSAYCSESARD